MHLCDPANKKIKKNTQSGSEVLFIIKINQAGNLLHKKEMRAVED